MDIDLDFANRDDVLKLFKHIPASRLDKDKLVKHNTGVYLHEVPVDPISGTCSIPYNSANNFFKIDFLNVHVYAGVKNEDHLIKLLAQEPDWNLFQYSEIVDQLFHINGHSDILKKTKPNSVEQLAAVLAMIRPAKKHLIGKDWDTIFSEVWNHDNKTQYEFKKSHSVSYALAIIVQLNLICDSVNSNIRN
jgi:hypothetical protein